MHTELLSNLINSFSLSAFHRFQSHLGLLCADKNLALFLTRNPLLIIAGYHLKLLSGFQVPLYALMKRNSLNTQKRYKRWVLEMRVHKYKF